MLLLEGRRRWPDYEEDFVRFLKGHKVSETVIGAWLCRTALSVRVRWVDIRAKSKGLYKRGERRQRRFEHHFEIDPGRVVGLSPFHPAVTEGRTLFPSTVVAAARTPRLLVSGANQSKLGSVITKGPWRGLPIYHLTLEERATCPSGCGNWRICYGNGMPRARRHRVDDQFFDRLEAELDTLSRVHKQGFAVRLHTLGDFTGRDYANQWLLLLAKFPRLHVFGFTAHARWSAVGRAINCMNLSPRSAIRFSGDAGPMGSVTIWEKARGRIGRDTLVCPAQTNDTACCAECGLCWHPAMKETAIAFMAHGR